MPPPSMSNGLQFRGWNAALVSLQKTSNHGVRELLERTSSLGPQHWSWINLTLTPGGVYCLSSLNPSIFVDTPTLAIGSSRCLWLEKVQSPSVGDLRIAKIANAAEFLRSDFLSGQGHRVLARIPVSEKSPCLKFAGKHASCYHHASALREASEKVVTFNHNPGTEVIASRLHYASLYFLCGRRLVDVAVLGPISVHAEKRGIKGLFITVVLQRREKDMQIKFVDESGVAKVQETNQTSTGEGFITYRPTVRARQVFHPPNHLEHQQDPSWWFKSIISMSIVHKGVATPEDALMRYDYGLAGIVLLNHSGWRLVTARPGIKNLVEIMEALKLWGSRPNPKLEVFADGGPSAVHRRKDNCPWCKNHRSLVHLENRVLGRHIGTFSTTTSSVGW
ncbi:hypothetical protein L210DRAFT_3506405 [Boletus edulis BED1]|uniref:FMN-dependent dehydrogenase domain-containing protein n=1 Tax=Boletus edulis BED1 TaxID=1328754 RepID=A0AAD4BN67_BOLED|nr:hypothetical protein L210DRAFT_3506405 [Boletus edulis BED1]